MPELNITATFNGQPGLSFVQGEDRQIAVSFDDANTGAAIDLTGADVRFCFDGLAGGTVRRCSGPLTLAASSVSAGQPFLLVNHGLVTGDPVTFTSAGTLPAPLATATTYLVNVLDVNTFSLTSSSTGAAVVITGAPSVSYSMQLSDVTVLTPVTSGNVALTLRAPVTAAIQDGEAQSFQVEIYQNNRLRIVIEQNELDVYAQVAP